MNRSFSTSLALCTAVAGTLLASSIAPDAAQAFSLSIAPQYGSTEGTGATANLDFDFVQQGNDVLLNLGIRNTTNGTAGLGATQATLVGLAVDLKTGPVTGFNYNSSNSSFTSTYSNVSIPGSFGNISFDYGIRSAGSGNFVGGNPQAGLTAGQSTVVSFLLTGNGSLNAAAVEQSFFNGYSAGGGLFAAGRFQQVNAGGGSDKVLGGGVTSAEAVPEPTTMAGLAIAGAGFAGLRRRRAIAKV